MYKRTQKSIPIQAWAALLLWAVAGPLGCQGDGKAHAPPESGSTGSTAPTPEAEEPGTIGMSLTTSPEGGAQVRLDYNPQPISGGQGPRAMEVYVEYPPEHLTYQGFTALEATTRADKTLIVQDKGNGVLRVILFASTNLEALQSGGLAQLEFQKKGSGGWIALRESMPVFAPAGANQGFVFPEPLSIGGTPQ